MFLFRAESMFKDLSVCPKSVLKKFFRYILKMYDFLVTCFYIKWTRNSELIQEREEGVPKINDILSGLLSVVGEGLSFANSYVQVKKYSNALTY